MEKKTSADYVVRGIFLLVASMILLALVVLFSSCSPVKQVLKDDNKMREVFEEAVRRDWCETDSTVVFLPGEVTYVNTPVTVEKKVLDTTLLKEIVKKAVDSADNESLAGMKMSYAAGYNDAIDAIKEQKIEKRSPDTLEIRKPDKNKIQLLEKDILKLNAELETANETIKKKEADYKEMKAARNKWRLYVWIILITFGLYLFRRPLWGVVRKALSLIKL